MSVYNGLTKAQWNTMTKMLNILADKCDNKAIQEHTLEFRKTVLNESYKLIVKDLQDQMAKLSSKMPEIKVQCNGDIPDYLKAALAQYQQDEQSKINAEIEKIKAEIVDINDKLIVTPPPAKETAKEAAHKPIQEAAAKEAFVTFGDLINNIVGDVLKSETKSMPTAELELNKKKLEEMVKDEMSDLVKAIFLVPE